MIGPFEVVWSDGATADWMARCGVHPRKKKDLHEPTGARLGSRPLPAPPWAGHRRHPAKAVDVFGDEPFKLRR
jgi:hypothetical protein